MLLKSLRFFMAKVVIGVGSNVGNRIGTIHKGIDLLAKKGRVLDQSFLYETDPMYVHKQPKFINCAILYETREKPFKLLRTVKRIEQVAHQPHSHLSRN